MDKMTWFLSKPLQVKHAFFFITNFIFIRKFVCFSGKINMRQSFFPQKNRSCVFTSCPTPRPPNARWPGVQLWNSSGAAWASKLSTRSSLKLAGFCSHTLQGTNLPYPTKRVSAGKSSGRKCRRLPGDMWWSFSAKGLHWVWGLHRSIHPSIHPSMHPSIIRCTCIYFRIFLANYLSTYFVSSHLSYPSLAYPMYARNNPSLPKQWVLVNIRVGLTEDPANIGICQPKTQWWKP